MRRLKLSTKARRRKTRRTRRRVAIRIESAGRSMRQEIININIY
jgi:hypothetical protein